MTFRPARAIAAALVIATSATLSGCAVVPVVRFIGAPVAKQPTTAAGIHYLDVICPRNAGVYAFNRVRATRDLAVLHAVAADAAERSATAAAGLRAPDAPWPAGIRGEIELLAVSLDQDASSYRAVAAAATLQEAWDVSWPGQTSAGDARFEIRRAVGLGDGQSADDCVGHYGPSAGESTT